MGRGVVRPCRHGRLLLCGTVPGPRVNTAVELRQVVPVPLFRRMSWRASAGSLDVGDKPCGQNYLVRTRFGLVELLFDPDLVNNRLRRDFSVLHKAGSVDAFGADACDEINPVLHG